MVLLFLHLHSSFKHCFITPLSPFRTGILKEVQLPTCHSLDTVQMHSNTHVLECVLMGACVHSRQSTPLGNANCSCQCMTDILWPFSSSNVYVYADDQSFPLKPVFSNPNPWLFSLIASVITPFLLCAVIRFMKFLNYFLN